MPKIEISGTLLGDGPSRVIFWRASGADGLPVTVVLGRSAGSQCVLTLDSMQTHDGHSPPFAEGGEEGRNLSALRLYAQRVLEEARGKLIAEGHATSFQFAITPADGIFAGTPTMVPSFEEAWPEGVVLPGTVVMVGE